MASLGVQSSVEHCSLGLVQIVLLQGLGFPFLRKLEESSVDHLLSHVAGFLLILSHYHIHFHHGCFVFWVVSKIPLRQSYSILELGEMLDTLSFFLQVKSRELNCLCLASPISESHPEPGPLEYFPFHVARVRKCHDTKFSMANYLSSCFS